MCKSLLPAVGLILFTSVTLSAQTPEWQWAGAMGSDGTNACYAITMDHSAGAVYATGWFEGTVDFDPGSETFELTSAGGQDIFISKFDIAGNFLWAVNLGGTSDDVGYSIAADATADGDIYVAGWFADTADFDPDTSNFLLSSSGSTDIFITKLSQSGSFIWAKAMGSDGLDGANSLAVNPAGGEGLFVAGYFSGSVDFDPNEGELVMTANGGTDMFISKFEASGNMSWIRTTGGSEGDIAYAIAFDPVDNGRVYSTGIFGGDVDFDPGVETVELTASGGVDVFISKYSDDGNFGWARRVGGTTSTVAYALAVDTSASHSVYFTGAFRESADFNPGSGTNNLTAEGWRDIFVAKLDSAGNYIWAKAMGGAENDKGFGLSIDPAGEGDVYVTGEFIESSDFDPGSGTHELTSSGDTDIFISKLDSSGNFVWAKSAGGTSSDYCMGIVADTASTVYIAGYFESPEIAFGTTFLENPDGNSFYPDALVAALHEVPVGVANVADLPHFGIFPNPASDLFSVAVAGNNACNIIVQDMMGRKILEAKSTSPACIFATGSWPDGVYIVRILSDKVEMNGKLVIGH